MEDFRFVCNQVDKVEGGIRLGFIAVEDGATQTLVYIDCLVSQAPVWYSKRSGTVL